MSRSARRGLLIAAVLTGFFVWAMTVVGITFAMVERSMEHWWLVLMFGLLFPALPLSAVHALLRGASGARGASHEAAAPLRDPSTPTVTPPSPRVQTSSETPAKPAVEPLSQRELEVLQSLATGRSNSEIAAHLHVATGTVKAHLNSIFRKLEASSRLHAVARAHELDLIDDRK